MNRKESNALMDLCDKEMILLPINPRSAPRPRSGRRGSRAHYPSWYYEYREDIQGLISGHGIDKSLAASWKMAQFTFAFKYPKSTKKADLIEGMPTQIKKDNDNLVKGVMDAMTKTGLVVDDSQLFTTMVTKIRTIGEPYISVVLFACDDETVRKFIIESRNEE